MIDFAEPKSEVSDDTLLVLFGNGDLSAARLLTDRLAPRVLSYATRMLGGDLAEAEDVTQDAMLRLWQMAPNWQQGQARVSTWLYRVAGNLCIDRLRKSKPEQMDPEVEFQDETAGIDAELQDRARLAALHRALWQLPDRQRQAVVLRHIEGLGNAQIAEIMNVGIEAVESLTARGKKALKENLASQKEELGYRDV